MRATAGGDKVRRSMSDGHGARLAEAAAPEFETRTRLSFGWQGQRDPRRRRLHRKPAAAADYRGSTPLAGKIGRHLLCAGNHAPHINVMQFMKRYEAAVADGLSCAVIGSIFYCAAGHLNTGDQAWCGFYRLQVGR